MAILKLDDNYSVVTDTYNFTLKSEIKTFDTKKDKEVISKGEWHFPSLQLALQKYLNECLRPLTSISDLNKELLRIEDLLLKIK